MQTPLQEKTLTRHGAQIQYWTGGYEGAPLLVLTHGAAINAHEWDATLPVVSTRFRVLTWDMPGHGRSRGRAFAFQGAVEDLLAILDQEGEEQAIFLGHSLGGNIQQEFAFLHPRRVRAMGCVDCTWNFQKLSGLDRFMLRIAEPLLKLYPPEVLLESSVKASAITPEAQELLRTAMQATGRDELIRILLAATLCLRHEPTYTFGKQLLLVCGDLDRTGNIRKLMPLWAQHEPDCRFELFMDASHSPNLDEPARFHKVLMDFLSGVI